MVVFQELREFKVNDLASKVSDEEHIKYLKMQVAHHHKHNDGSPVVLELAKGKSKQDIVEDNAVREQKKGEPIIFSCMCGKDFSAEQKGNTLSIATYLPNKEYGAAASGSGRYGVSNRNSSYGG